MVTGKASLQHKVLLGYMVLILSLIHIFLFAGTLYRRSCKGKDIGLCSEHHDFGRESESRRSLYSASDVPDIPVTDP